MHPILFRFKLPEFLQALLPGNAEYLTMYTYGFCISLGIIAAYLYAWRQAKKELNVPQEVMTRLLIILVIAAVVGGKVFTFLERPSFYFSHFDVFLRGFKSGFVFYGSLLFAIPAMIWFFRSQQLPVLQMFDIMAITATIVHAFGRMGCFFAGCCHGVPTHSVFGVVFSDPYCAADPKNVPLHPTQLYEVFLLVLIMSFLLFYKKRKRFHGELFLIYLILYAIGRGIIEFYRGDESRGYLFNHLLSHSQFIALIVLAVTVVLYFILLKADKKRKSTIVKNQGQSSE